MKQEASAEFSRSVSQAKNNKFSRSHQYLTFQLTRLFESLDSKQQIREDSTMRANARAPAGNGEHAWRDLLLNLFEERRSFQRQYGLGSDRCNYFSRTVREKARRSVARTATAMIMKPTRDATSSVPLNIRGTREFSRSELHAWKNLRGGQGRANIMNTISLFVEN